jgi:hypothetical protein
MWAGPSGPVKGSRARPGSRQRRLNTPVSSKDIDMLPEAIRASGGNIELNGVRFVSGNEFDRGTAAQPRERGRESVR